MATVNIGTGAFGSDPTGNPVTLQTSVPTFLGTADDLTEGGTVLRVGDQFRQIAVENGDTNIGVAIKILQ